MVQPRLDSLNPFLAMLQSSTEIGRLMYDYLTAYARRTTSRCPGLAERWEPSADKLTWTFTIREGTKWSDGQPITARTSRSPTTR